MVNWNIPYTEIHSCVCRDMCWPDCVDQIVLSTKCTSLGEDASVYVTVAVAYLSNILNVRRYYRVISSVVISLINLQLVQWDSVHYRHIRPEKGKESASALVSWSHYSSMRGVRVCNRVVGGIRSSVTTLEGYSCWSGVSSVDKVFVLESCLY